VTVDIYNVNGQKVRTLVDRTYGPGTYTVEWDATSDNGQQVASGVYLYRFTAGDVTQTKKMSFVK
jgi:flagellar hook assembly protein FlgD